MNRNSQQRDELRDGAMPQLEQIAERVERLRIQRARFARLWAYWRNPMHLIGTISADSSQSRPYRQAQEWGLPQRITGYRSSCTTELSSQEPSDESARKEVVIENDIGWRIETMVDYLFGREVVITSSATDPSRRKTITALLREIIAGNGGMTLLQEMALLGAVHGFVDVLVKLQSDPRGLNRGRDEAGVGRAADEAGNAPSAETGDSAAEQSVLDDFSSTHTGASGSDSRDASTGPDARGLARLARMVRLEIVEPARALPFVSGHDYREVTAYGQCCEIEKPPRQIREGASSDRASRPWLDRLRRLTQRNPLARCEASGNRTIVVEMITPTRWARYEEGRVVASGANSLGRVPLVHIQNTAMPFQYGGGSDVEPLIPLQDELNTRLSDRASRITLQSFKMYLGKGIENFTSMPVSPGRMWMSDNEQADVIEFGGDSSCPSEDSHISDIREALDKASGVTPIAAGAVEGRIGHLTSAVALRITLQALLAKTEKKRTAYGTGIERMCELALAWLDRAGLFATRPDERGIELSWPTPVPENQMERLQEAQAKLRLGVERDVVLRELGYGGEGASCRVLRTED